MQKIKVKPVKNMENNLQKQWVKVKEASAITGLHPHTIRKYVKMGVIEGRRIYESITTHIWVNLSSIPPFLLKKSAVKNEKEVKKT